MNPILVMNSVYAKDVKPASTLGSQFCAVVALQLTKFKWSSVVFSREKTVSSASKFPPRERRKRARRTTLKRVEGTT